MVCTEKRYLMDKPSKPFLLPFPNCLKVGFHVLLHSKNNQLPGEYIHCEKVNQKKKLFILDVFRGLWVIYGHQHYLFIEGSVKRCQNCHHMVLMTDRKLCFFFPAACISFTIALISQLKVSCGFQLSVVCPFGWSGSGSVIIFNILLFFCTGCCSQANIGTFRTALTVCCQL